jgi:hypothetical protein
MASHIISARQRRYTPEQQLAVDRIVWNLRNAERHGRELVSTLEACARVARSHNLPAEDGIDLCLSVLPPHRARASLVGEIFAAVFERGSL